MSARLLTAAVLVGSLFGCSATSEAKKRGQSAGDTPARPEGEKSADDGARRVEEQRRRNKEEQRQQAVRKRAEDFLYRLGLKGAPRAAEVRSRFMALSAEDQAKALRTAGLLQTFGRSALLKEDPPRKEAVFLKGHPELFPEP